MLMETEPLHLFETQEKRWKAFLEKDPRAVGKFFTAVKTTGIYCLPTCPARLPKPENVQFFSTAAEAAAAGYRPCKRCQPDRLTERSEQAERILRASALLEHADVCPTLDELADSVGLSRFYFQRQFRKIVGITPKQYFMQKRAERLRANLADAETVTKAVYTAGFGSSAQFYAQTAETLGMKPGEYRSGGAGIEIWYTLQPCSLGWVLIAATRIGICTIEFGDIPQELEDRLKGRFPQARFPDKDPFFTTWVEETLAYIEHPREVFSLPLDIQGTAFQRRVWKALQAIPSGQRVSYKEIARQIGQPTASRAVAQACAANRVAVAIPCHRVVRGNGDLGGYKWGLARKERLLAREAQPPREVLNGESGQ